MAACTCRPCDSCENRIFFRREWTATRLVAFHRVVRKKKGSNPWRSGIQKNSSSFHHPLLIEKRFSLLSNRERYPRVSLAVHTCAPLSKRFDPFYLGRGGERGGESKQRLPRTDGPIEPIGKICIYGGWIEEKIRKFHRRFSWFWIILHPDSLLGWIDGRFQRDGKKGPWIRYYYMLEIPVYRRGQRGFLSWAGWLEGFG